MSRMYRVRWVISAIVIVLTVVVPLIASRIESQPSSKNQSESAQGALDRLNTLPVKGRAPKTGYARSQFGDGWAIRSGCDMRNLILARDLINARVGDDCKIQNGTLRDPYTARTILFERGATTSDLVQIDHVVALSNAWQTGAQLLTPVLRESFANDPLNLLAVDGAANQEKSDGDAATWLPPNKPFRCQYVERQINVKIKYKLWVTFSERDAMERVLQGCT